MAKKKRSRCADSVTEAAKGMSDSSAEIKCSLCTVDLKSLYTPAKMTGFWDIKKNNYKLCQNHF